MVTKMKKITKCALIAALSAAALQANAYTDESFTATLNLLSPIQITEIKGLEFEDTLANQTIQVITSASDTKAATFSATGSPGWEVQGEVVESTINMVTGDGSTSSKVIEVGSFTYGGDMDSNGMAAFNSNGELSNLRVGGTAYVEAEDEAGSYEGTATFRLTYL